MVNGLSSFKKSIQKWSGSECHYQYCLWHINRQDLIDGVPVPKPNLADKLDDVQNYNILCILDIDGTRNRLTEIAGFNSYELKSILDSASTN